MLIFGHLVAGLCACALALAGSSSKKIAIVLDASGSMAASGTAYRALASNLRAAVPGRDTGSAPQNQRRIDVAKELTNQSVKEYEAKGFDIGLFVFTDCGAINLEMDFNEPSPAARIRGILNGVQPTGGTPIADSLKRAGEYLASLPGKEKEVLIVTDGMESCSGSPIDVARELKGKHGIKVSIVGLDIPQGMTSQLEEIAKAGGGTYNDEVGVGNAGKPIRELGGSSQVSFDGKDPNGRRLENTPMSSPAPPSFMPDPGKDDFDTKVMLK